jgi:hypothetical protein
VDAAKMIENALAKNPEIRMVLELASRARQIESKEPPRNIGMATETVAIPSRPQCLVSLTTQG